ncbi:serine/threonine protein kinase [Saccharomonospora amisosensis]|uniref:Serine/threonine protein kinase n=1 Tax=Saccharomonospora amisosensis TaxID=1128677 RepID=A0A7X5UUX2_9PSEU|nr:BREX system serine/threonine kinase PglW [Saccharomonospora amisosensis]NIJ14643.1 serine/threonine protein kinase [Saccharomonospora amisosensis]
MASGGKSAPKPKPPPALQRWFQERTSPYPWEQDGLDHVKDLMPQAEPYRAWATFSFTAASGRVNECDLLIAVPGGLYLVELKGHPGRVVNNGNTWSFFKDGSRRERILRNPLHLTDLKCKELKSRLEWAAKQLRITQRVPRVEPAIFLSAPDLRSELDEVQSTRVYGRDGVPHGLPWIWRDLLAKPPQREHQRVSPEFSRHVLPKLLEKIGISVSTAHLRFGDDWTLSGEALDAGPTWEDRLAEHKGLVPQEGRVRIYLTERQASDERRQSVDRAARREYQVLQGINHRGIAQAVQIREHQAGPAILFQHKSSDLRLDSYLDLHGDRLSLQTRLDLVRQLAEAVQYAHQRALYHRALAARSVYVSAKHDGSQPVLRIIDWQAAARDFDTTGFSSIGNTSLTGEHLAGAAEVYLAPEFDTPYADPVDLDIFGLGALAYLLLTGQPPATQRSGLIERLAENKGLHPYAVSDGISDALDALVFDATRTDLAQRLDSADAFLKRLGSAEWQSVPSAATRTVDPLEATTGEIVDGDWVVERVLGTGATARALLVSRTQEDEDGTAQTERRVLKIALDENKAARLQAEARALEVADGGVVVRLLDGPRELGGRTVLDLEYAGGQDPDGRTLGELLRAEGRLSYHYLERFGRDLFTALDQLAGKGVRHRDLKPDNFGVYRRADRSTQLMLFDFSLADASDRDVKAGTRGYLDPFLDTARRPGYDDHAERYAAAVTLHEMASGQRPVWGDGMTDPRTTTDEVPAIAADLFEPALRDELTAFFLRAFHRDVDRRFDTFRQMEDAWRAVFISADAAAPVTTPGTVGLEESSLEETRDAHAAAAKLDTQLEAAGLTPRAVSVAHSFGATTVGELLDVQLYEIAKARGAGAVVRKELNRRHKQWSQALLTPGEDRGRAATPTEGQLTIDDMAALLAPKSARRGSKRADVVRLVLGLPNGDGLPHTWPTQSEVAQRLDITQATVSNHYRAAVKEWAAMPWLADVRDELVELLGEAGRVMTAHELAAALRARHGVARDDSAQRTAARAVAIVRAAVETEVWTGLQAKEPDDEPRLVAARRGRQVLVALESMPGSNDPSAPELADYAVALGARADELVAEEPLPGRGVVVRELRAVPAPEGLPSLADTRLVELAAELSARAAVSPRLELYPTELELVRALRISQAGAGVRREPGVTMEDLLAKVRARFPAVVLDEDLTHVRLEEALRAAGFPLEYDTATRRFRARAPELSRVATSSSTAMSGHGRLRAAGLDPRDVLAAKLTSAVERGGFLALTLRGIYLPGAAEALAASYPLQSVNVDREFLSVFRALATERGQDWDKVRKLDARYSETGEPSRGLAAYARDAWNRVQQRLLDLAEGKQTILFLHHASLLGRYYDQGGHQLLTGLQNAARRSDEVPHGLWLLCPADSALETPQLDQRIVEVLTDSERVVLDRQFLATLRGEAGNVA